MMQNRTNCLQLAPGGIIPDVFVILDISASYSLFFSHKNTREF